MFHYSFRRRSPITNNKTAPTVDFSNFFNSEFQSRCYQGNHRSSVSMLQFYKHRGTRVTAFRFRTYYALRMANTMHQLSLTLFDVYLDFDLSQNFSVDWIDCLVGFCGNISVISPLITIGCYRNFHQNSMVMASINLVQLPKIIQTFAERFSSCMEHYSHLARFIWINHRKTW